jgi:glycerol-3-phosphate acyltransferase PlsY
MIETLGLVPWGSAWPYIFAAIFIAYLIGAIPFGLIFGWLSGAGDVRKIGSGNIGATNVLRTGKRWAAAATLICDALKGYIAVNLGGHFGGQAFAVFAGLGVFLGHLFPVWLGFKGGKGVATFIGITFALGPMIAALTCITWLTVAYLFRYSSLAALFAVTLTPVYFMFPTVRATLFAALTALLAVFVIVAHRANIARLLRGQEPKIGAR